MQGRTIVLSVSLILSACATASGPVQYVVLTREPQAKVTADLASCNAYAEEQVELEHRRAGIEPYSTGEKAGLIVLGGLVAGAAGAGRVAENLRVKEYVIGRPGAYHNFYRATCMQDRGYTVIIPDGTEQEELDAAETAAERRAVLDRLYRRHAK